MRIWNHQSYVGLYFVTDDAGQIVQSGLTLREALALAFALFPQEPR